MKMNHQICISLISILPVQRIHCSVTNLQVPPEKQTFQDETGGVAAAACADQKPLANGKKL